MKALAVLIVGFVLGVFAPEFTNPHLSKLLKRFATTPVIAGLDPLALVLIALVLVGIHLARAKHAKRRAR